MQAKQMVRLLSTVVAGVCLTALLHAQTAAPLATPPSQMVSAATIKSVSDSLLQQAKASPDGLAFKVLLTRADGEEQLAVRVKSGQGEWHHDVADILVVLDGEAQIVTGGELQQAKVTAPGEMRGEGIRNGKTQSFRTGDVIRIEPQTPHQILVPAGGSIRYFVVKVRAHSAQ